MMNDIQLEIIKFLESTRGQYTINEISEQLSIDRHTAGKYLEALQAMGICEFVAKGKSKLWSITPSPLFSLLSKENPIANELRDLLSKIEDDISLQDKDHTIIWSNKNNQKNKKCFEVFANRTSVCKDCGITSTPHTKIHTHCMDSHLITQPIVDKENKLVAIMNIRKKKMEN